MRAALERAARVVKTEAKAELGQYQDAAPPLVGWAELAQATKDQRVALGFTENDPGLRSGEMRDGIEHEVEVTAHVGTILHGRATIGSADDKMLWFEIGTERQPPRSALGGALVRKTNEVVDIIGHGAAAALTGRGATGLALPLP